VTLTRWSPPGRPTGSDASMASRTARIRRLVRLRTTAFPTLRGIANANRGGASGSSRVTSRRGPRPVRVPSVRKRRNDRWVESREITPTSGPAPSGDEHAPRPGRLAYSSVIGIRVSWPACERLADMGASWVLQEAAGKKGTAGKGRRVGETNDVSA